MKPIAKISAREQVTKTLRKAIFNGEFKNGEEIRQEDIASKLGVSRMPVREAFMLLERDGLLILKNNKRAAVNVFTEEDFKDHYDIRTLLESQAAAKAANKEQDFSELDRILEELDRATENDDTLAYVAGNEAFHRGIWKCAGSKRLESFLSQLWGGLPAHLPELLAGQMKKSAREHKEILEMIKAGNAEEARKKTVAHLERSKRDFLGPFSRTFHETKSKEDTQNIDGSI